MTAAIDITKEQRKMLLALLRRFIPGVAVWAYGSRVKWTARPNSDLDLVAFTTPAQSPLVAELKEALAESNLPFLVDFHVWHEVPERFHEIIRKEYIVLQEAEEKRLGGDVAGRWMSASIQEVSEKVAMGPFGSSIKVETFVPQGVPVISGQHLRGTRLADLDYNFISLEHADKLANANVKRGDVVFTHAGNIGQVAYIPESSKYERYVISQRQFYLRPNTQKVLPEFIAYYFTSADGQHKLLANASSSGVPSIAQPVSYLRTINIPVPPLPEQKAIAHILGTLDDKIELNRRMNATLEAMARALFQSWFVDFDPVRAKLDGRKPAGLDTATAALFPAHFQDSPLGHIPQGWKVKPLSEITTVITKGTTPTQQDVASAPDNDAQINYVRVNSIEEDGSIISDKLTKIPLSVHAGVLKRSILQTNDVLYTIAGTIGRTATAENWVLPANTNQAVAIIRPKPTIPSSFLVLTMRHEVFREELHNNIVHAVQANLSLGMLSKARAVVPPEDVLLQIFKPIDDIMSQISGNRAQSRILATIRDALLPKLLSGELRVVNGEEEVASV